MNWFRTHKFLVVVLGLIVLTLFLSALGSDKPSNSASKPANQVPKSTSQKADYQLVGEFGPTPDIKAVVIDPSAANESDLTAIGKKLDAKYGNSAKARIGVYTSRKEAELLLNDPLQTQELKGADATAYKNAWVAQYTLDASAHKKTFTIYLNGTSKDINL